MISHKPQRLRRKERRRALRKPRLVIYKIFNNFTVEAAEEADCEKGDKGGKKVNHFKQNTEKTSLLVAEGHTEYNYLELLDRFSKLLRDKNPSLAEGQKLKKDEDPYIVNLGTTKTAWQNFDALVTAMDRKHDHVLSYIAAELGVEAVLGPENNLILQGRFKGKNIERLYNKYKENYVKCINCGGY